jgi:hypothetical protein
MKPATFSFLFFGIPFLLLHILVNPSYDKQKIDNQADFLPQYQAGKDICWKGNLNGKTPVLLHYQAKDDIVAY